MYKPELEMLEKWCGKVKFVFCILDELNCWTSEKLELFVINCCSIAVAALVGFIEVDLVKSQGIITPKI